MLNYYNNLMHFIETNLQFKMVINILRGKMYE